MIELVMESGIDNGDTLLLICPSKFSGPIQQGIGLDICTPESVYGYSFMYDIHDDNGNLIHGVPETQDMKHNELQGKEIGAQAQFGAVDDVLDANGVDDANRKEYHYMKSLFEKVHLTEESNVTKFDMCTLEQ
eukprot:8682-Heterococcus_DN1.PRE.1